MFGVIRSNKTKHTRTIIVSRYLRLCHGLVPGKPLLVAVSGCCGVVRKEGPSLLGPFGLPRWGGLPFLVSRAGGENFPLPPPCFHGRRAPRCYRTMSSIRPCTGDLSWSPRPSSWPSSPAPHRAPEPASPLGEHPLDLRAGGLDNRSAPLSLPSPVKMAWRLRSRAWLYWGKGHLMRYKRLTGLVGRFALSPRSSVRGGGTSADLNSTLQMSWCVVSKSSRRVWCLAESNSHILNARL